MTTAQTEFAQACNRNGHQAVEATDENIVRGFLAFAAELASLTSTRRLARYAELAARWTHDPRACATTELFLRNVATYAINVHEARLATFVHSAFLSLVRGDALPVIRSADRVVAANQWPRLLQLITHDEPH